MQTAIDSIHATSIPPDFFLQSSARPISTHCIYFVVYTKQ